MAFALSKTNDNDFNGKFLCSYQKSVEITPSPSLSSAMPHWAYPGAPLGLSIEKPFKKKGLLEEQAAGSELLQLLR